MQLDNKRFYHVDKNGKSLAYVIGYKIRDSKGEYFEMFGTGLKIPGDCGIIKLWTVDQKVVSRKTNEIEIVMSDDEFVFVNTIITIVIVFIIVSFANLMGWI